MNIRQPYQFVLELLKRGAGTPLGRVPVVADWEPVLEAARFFALRRFPLATCGEDVVAELRPAWHSQLGEPWVGGFEVGLQIPGAGEVSCLVPNSYFKALAVDASAPLVKKGTLEAGELFDFRVTAYPTPLNALAKATPRPRFEVAEVSTPLPLKLSSIKDFQSRSFVFGEHHEGDLPVFIPQEVLAEVEQATLAAATVETASVLIGHLHRDRDDGDLFLEITAQIPARNSQGTATKVTFGPETWNAVQAAVALRGENEIWAGWFHSHPAAAWCNPKCPPEARANCSLQRSFFSADDCDVHRTVFSKAFNIALLVTSTDAGLQRAMFSWRNGVIAQRGFHIIGNETEQKNAVAPAAPATIGNAENEKPCP